MGSINMAGSKILITGAGGFIGQALTSALLQDDSVNHIILTDITAPKIPEGFNQTTSSCHVESLAADLTSPSTCEQLFTPDLTHVYLLHGIMSGAAEANLELGLRVN